MTEAATEPQEATETKPAAVKRKASKRKSVVPKPDPLVAAASKTEPKTAAALPDGIEIGDVVIYMPQQAALDTMRSVRGMVCTGWPAMVTYIHDKPAVALDVRRPFNMSPISVHEAKYDPDGAPGTFRLKAKATKPQT